jgi:hypothetical protein
MWGTFRRLPGVRGAPDGDLASDNNWWGLLLTPVLHKVNRGWTAPGDPIYRVGIMDWVEHVGRHPRREHVRRAEFDTDVDKSSGAALQRQGRSRRRLADDTARSAEAARPRWPACSQGSAGIRTPATAARSTTAARRRAALQRQQGRSRQQIPASIYRRRGVCGFRRRPSITPGRISTA